MTTSLAAAGQKLRALNNKKVVSPPLPKKKTKSDTGNEQIQKKIEETRKQLELERRSNADMFSEESYTSEDSHSSEESESYGDFIDNHCEEECHGPLADLSSQSGISGNEEEEEDDEESISTDLRSEDDAPNSVKQPSKRPRPLDQLRQIMAEQKKSEKKRKIDAYAQQKLEEEDKYKRMQQLELTLDINIKEYERLRQIATDTLKQTQLEIARLEEAESREKTQLLFVLDQQRLEELSQSLRKKEAVLNEEKQAIEVREKLIVEKQEASSKQFATECDARMKELEQKEQELAAKSEEYTKNCLEKSKQLDHRAEELEKKEKALLNTTTTTTTSKNGMLVGSSNILEGFITEMRKTNQNTLSKEILGTIISPHLMNNIATLALSAKAPQFKTCSVSNSQYIIVEVEAQDGTVLLRHTVSKQLYNVK